MYIRKSILIISLLGGLSLLSCGNKKGDNDVAEIDPAVLHDKAIPETVKKLVKAVADNDSAGFASLVSYPLQRPYPLHDIDSPEQMSEYYHHLVDDSLRNVIVKAGTEKWSEYGWRGWSLDDGRYIWIDENVYDVNYVSNSEQRNIDSLRRVEFASIEPSIREGWQPVMCLTDSTSKHVYRVDTRLTGSPEEAHHYRLAYYGQDSALSGVPSKLIEGEMEIEGSAGSVVYLFHDNNGKGDYILQPESAETADPILIDPAGNNVLLRRAYWHELIKNK